MVHVFGFIEFYLAPFIFAVGLVLFVYGIINYYIVGPGYEEDRREQGRQNLLWATLLFLVGLIVFALASWLFDLSKELDERLDADVEREEGLLRVPNVPRQ